MYTSNGTHYYQPEAGSYTYSGMHDQGPLPPPKEGGPMATLIGCVQQAKRDNDKYLTEIIEHEKKQRTISQGGSHQSRKGNHDASEATDDPSNSKKKLN